MRSEILASAEKLERSMTEALMRLCSVPAVSPHNGGTGEDAKILELAKIIDELGLKDITLRVEHVDDDKAPSGRRPSLFLEHPGKKSRRICILSHIDVVPEGDRSAWTLDPFKPEIRGPRLYGRGVSDNGTCLVSSLFALKALQDAGVTPEYTVLLAFVADEELKRLWILRKRIAGVDEAGALNLILDKLRQTENNAEFLNSIKLA